MASQVKISAFGFMKFVLNSVLGSMLCSISCDVLSYSHALNVAAVTPWDFDPKFQNFCVIVTGPLTPHTPWGHPSRFFQFAYTCCMTNFVSKTLQSKGIISFLVHFAKSSLSTTQTGCHHSVFKGTSVNAINLPIILISLNRTVRVRKINTPVLDFKVVL